MYTIWFKGFHIAGPQRIIKLHLFHTYWPEFYSNDNLSNIMKSILNLLTGIKFLVMSNKITKSEIM